MDTEQNASMMSMTSVSKVCDSLLGLMLLKLSFHFQTQGRLAQYGHLIPTLP
jgi:hypothetical protein